LGNGGDTYAGLLVPAALRIARGVFRTTDPTPPQLKACVDAKVLGGRRVILVVGGRGLWKNGASFPYSMMSSSRVVIPNDGDARDISDLGAMQGILSRMKADSVWLSKRAVVVSSVGAAVMGLLYVGYTRSQNAKVKTVQKQQTREVSSSAMLISHK
jgi:hypothetical protein